MSDAPFHDHALRVYFEDTDAGGIVYHANYLRFAERARTEALRAMGLPHADMQAKHGCFLVVKRAAVEYERPARLDDEVTVRTRIRRVAATLLLEQELRRGEERLAMVEVTLVCVDQGTLTPRRLPEPWLGALRARIAAPVAAPLAEGGPAP
ncbi:tol-pal system-associated acyl-CoA thioesterase [Rubritepida flocculans]|jgi:acyl-CoA thioester hydrolase|uniref:tol-pal system-associated acyl-CoA thioesterase n=1 Tax=Rubritepida flocculans TaxID=182403 RepID=UPI000406088A|nr:tol-pal system-associated acyl-CoA thioesterase [Rubritepida flocculans]